MTQDGPTITVKIFLENDNDDNGDHLIVQVLESRAEQAGHILSGQIFNHRVFSGQCSSPVRTPFTLSVKCVEKPQLNGCRHAVDVYCVLCFAHLLVQCVFLLHNNMQFVRQSREGGMAVCRHEQNEESREGRAQTQQGKTNSAKNLRKTGKKHVGIKGG